MDDRDQPRPNDNRLREPALGHRIIDDAKPSDRNSTTTQKLSIKLRDKK
jgi:hypothetical protein